MDELIASLTALADAVEAGKPERAVADLLARTTRACEQAASQASAEPKALLQNFRQAPAAWTEVWPRMGVRPEFRAAVAREARLWAARLAKIR